MKLKIKHLVVAVSMSATGLGLVSGVSLAHGTGDIHPTIATKTDGLRKVMQGLLDDSQQINAGIVLEDFKMIEAAATKIANHPNPGPATMKKVKGYLGAEIASFKGFDMVVHDTAVDIAKAASDKDMTGIVSGYHQLIDGCLSCHNKYKQRVAKILK